MIANDAYQQRSGNDGDKKSGCLSFGFFLAIDLLCSRASLFGFYKSTLDLSNRQRIGRFGDVGESFGQRIHRMLKLLDGLSASVGMSRRLHHRD